MHSTAKDWRKKNIMFNPRHYCFDSYHSDVTMKEIKHSFGEELNNLHFLADSIITTDDSNNIRNKRDKNLLNMAPVEVETPSMVHHQTRSENTSNPTFAGITNFFYGVYNVIQGAMSQWRPKSPAQYYDCYDDSNVNHQGSPPNWQASNTEVQNKSVPFDEFSDAQNSQSNMNKDCKVAVAQCEDKLNRVRLLLETKPVPTPKFRPRRPRKVFVEPGSVEETFEDAFTPEDFVSVSNDSFVECYSPCQYQNQELLEIESPKMKTGIAPVHESAEIVKVLPVKIEKCDIVSNKPSNPPLNINENIVKIENTVLATEPIKKHMENVNEKEVEIPPKPEIVQSCEDKASKLKALLQERRKNNTKVITSHDSLKEPVEKSNEKVKPMKKVPIQQSKAKRYKNPRRSTDKRKKTKQRKNIQEDMLFAHEINSDELSSIENSPSTRSLTVDSIPVMQACIERLSDSNITLESDFFDEISGRFHSSPTSNSEDSFQIVFADSPQTSRIRRPSDCDSEDSFIVFEESPDNCYTSNDVFGNETQSDSEYSGSDSESCDSECDPETKLCHNLTKTFGDLTDDSLYDDISLDEVDCAAKTVCEEIPTGDIVKVSAEVCDNDANKVKSTGLLVNEGKKLLKKDTPPKKVQFSPNPPKVRVMYVWAYASRQARIGDWKSQALDRDRFKRRIADVDMAVSWVLKPQHRSRVMFQRFMPWWNKLKRIELAEKKAKAEEERLKKEEDDKLKKEEEERLKTEEELKKTEDIKVDNIDGKIGKEIEIIEKKTGNIKLGSVAANLKVNESNLANKEQEQGVKHAGVSKHMRGFIKSNGVMKGKKTCPINGYSEIIPLNDELGDIKLVDDFPGT